MSDATNTPPPPAFRDALASAEVNTKMWIRCTLRELAVCFIQQHIREETIIDYAACQAACRDFATQWKTQLSELDTSSTIIGNWMDQVVEEGIETLFMDKKEQSIAAPQESPLLPTVSRWKRLRQLKRNAEKNTTDGNERSRMHQLLNELMMEQPGAEWYEKFVQSDLPRRLHSSNNTDDDDMLNEQERIVQRKRKHSTRPKRRKIAQLQQPNRSAPSPPPHPANQLHPAIQLTIADTQELDRTYPHDSSNGNEQQPGGRLLMTMVPPVGCKRDRLADGRMRYNTEDRSSRRVMRTSGERYWMDGMGDGHVWCAASNGNLYQFRSIEMTLVDEDSSNSADNGATGEEASEITAG